MLLGESTRDGATATDASPASPRFCDSLINLCRNKENRQSLNIATLPSKAAGFKPHFLLTSKLPLPL